MLKNCEKNSENTFSDHLRNIKNIHDLHSLFIKVCDARRKILQQIREIHNTIIKHEREIAINYRGNANKYMQEKPEDYVQYSDAVLRYEFLKLHIKYLTSIASYLVKVGKEIAYDKSTQSNQARDIGRKFRQSSRGF